MSKKIKVSVIILAAGTGSRMGGSVTKQRIEILGKSVLKRCAEAFESSELVSDITVVCKSDEIEFVKNETAHLNKMKSVIIGGKCRAESAKLGFESLGSESDIVMIHDAARCLIEAYDIEKVALSAFEFGAATAAVRVRDTIKKCSPDGVIEATVPRENLYAAATPQAFSYSLYKRALEFADSLDESVTDDNMLVEATGAAIKCVQTSPTNVKITVASDMELAEFIIRKRENKL